MIKEIINDIVTDDINPWYGKLAVGGACIFAIYTILTDAPLKTVSQS
ncbi:MAG: hypothetical protein ACIPMY_05010 [Rickettsia endosymbiont of Pentastiridius leporinus]